MQMTVAGKSRNSVCMTPICGIRLHTRRHNMPSSAFLSSCRLINCLLLIIARSYSLLQLSALRWNSQKKWNALKLHCLMKNVEYSSQKMWRNAWLLFWNRYWSDLLYILVIYTTRFCYFYIFFISSFCIFGR